MSEIRYGTPGAAISSFQHVRVTSAPFDEVIERLRNEIAAAGLWVLHEIDPQAVLKRGGHAIGAGRQILCFHPDLMIRLLQADPSALLEAPLKFAVLDLPDGTVSIRWFDPAASFARYRNPLLEALGLGTRRNLRAHHPPRSHHRCRDPVGQVTASTDANHIS